MPAYDFDLFTIGAGSAGTRASRVSAELGARVAVAEESHLGGTCVNAGCIPKKLFVYASHYAEDFDDAAAYGWRVGPRQFDWETLRENKDAEVQRLNGVYARLLDQAGVTRLSGRARLVGPHTVEVAGRSFTSEHVLIATGGWPYRPDIPGVEHTLTSNEIFHLERFPDRVVIVGGGYVGVEFAAILDGMGAEVTLVHHGPLFLRGFDDDLRAILADEYRKRGIGLRFGAEVRAVERGAAEREVVLDDGSRLAADEILYATGRRPRTAGLGLEQAGVALGANGEVRVDAFSRSSVPGIWAVGDCTDRLNLTPMAIAEGTAFAQTVFGGRPTRPDHTQVPTAVFSQPALGTVGLTEAEARERGHAVDVYRSAFRPLRHTLTGRDEKTLVKLVVDRASDRVLGCHMVGPDAGETVQGLAVALRSGATKAHFDATVGIHPTAAEEFVTLREPTGQPAGQR